MFFACKWHYNNGFKYRYYCGYFFGIILQLYLLFRYFIDSMSNLPQLQVVTEVFLIISESTHFKERNKILTDYFYSQYMKDKLGLASSVVAALCNTLPSINFIQITK